jgi:hypothetical protein
VNGENGELKTAVFDQTRRYRYRLTRDWDDVRAERAGALGFVMLNPSTADEAVDDPTIRRCIGFAKGLGYGKLIVGNLFAYRATNPNDLLRVPVPVAIGPENDLHLLNMTVECDVIIAAWGTHKVVEAREHEVRQLFGPRLWHLGLTWKGHPKHPLYLSGDAIPVPWELTP